MREDVMKHEAFDLHDRITAALADRRARRVVDGADELLEALAAFRAKWERVGNAVDPDNPDQPATPWEP